MYSNVTQNDNCNRDMYDLNLHIPSRQTAFYSTFFCPLPGGFQKLLFIMYEDLMGFHWRFQWLLQFYVEYVKDILGFPCRFQWLLCIMFKGSPGLPLEVSLASKYNVWRISWNFIWRFQWLLFLMFEGSPGLPLKVSMSYMYYVWRISLTFLWWFQWLLCIMFEGFPGLPLLVLKASM